MKHSYGCDREGKEIIFDRKTAKIPHCLMTGSAGAGKTYNVKQEIIANLLHGDSEDKIIVVDVNGEYTGLSEEYGGETVDFINTFINPCDMAVYLDSVADMADFLMSFVEIASGKECNAVHKTIISNVCSSMYRLYKIGLTIEKDATNRGIHVIKRNECPTLADFYDKLRPYKKEVDRLLTAIKPYCNGLFNTFAHRTNVNPDSRLIVIDLSSVNERRMAVALQASLMYIWSVMTENVHKSAYTWIYLEELYRYFRNTSLTDTLLQIFRRSRMQGGIITGITQDIQDITCNEQANHIIRNWHCLKSQYHKNEK